MRYWSSSHGMSIPAELFLPSTFLKFSYKRGEETASIRNRGL